MAGKDEPLLQDTVQDSRRTLGGVLGLVLINWLLLGFEGLMFIVREKFIEAFMVLTTMRHFTRPVRPCFNFEDEWI